MRTCRPAEAPAAPVQLERDQIPARFKWNLTHIFADWAAWHVAYEDLDRRSRRSRRCRAVSHGEVSRSSRRSNCAMTSASSTYKVWYFAALKYDEDQRDNEINGKRQQVQILFAKAAQAWPGSIPSC